MCAAHSSDKSIRIHHDIPQQLRFISRWRYTTDHSYQLPRARKVGPVVTQAVGVRAHLHSVQKHCIAKSLNNQGPISSGHSRITKVVLHSRVLNQVSQALPTQQLLERAHNANDIIKGT